MQNLDRLACLTGSLAKYVRLGADGGRLLPLGIGALPLSLNWLNQRPNGLTSAREQAGPLEKHEPTTSVSCTQIRCRHASRYMRCCYMYDDETMPGQQQTSRRLFRTWSPTHVMPTTTYACGIARRLSVDRGPQWRCYRMQ